MSARGVTGTGNAANWVASRQAGGYAALGQLFKGLVNDLTTLASQELLLAKTEIQEKTARSTQAAVWLIGGGSLAFAGLVALVVGMSFGYGTFLPLWLAGLLVGLLVIIFGAMVIQVGRSRLRRVGLAPEKTLASLRADLTLIKEKRAGIMPAPRRRSTRQARQGEARTTGKEQTMWQILKDTVREWLDDKANQLAAALAYYTAISIAPLLVLVVVIVGLLLGRQTAETQLMQQLRDTIGVQGAEFLQTAIENAQEPSLASWAGILSGLTLLWGSTNLFSQLQTSLNAIWGVEPRPGLGIWANIRKRLLSFLMVIGAALLLLASMIVSSLLSALANLAPDWLPGGSLLWQGVNYGVSFIAITLVLAAIYKVLPDVEISWRYVWLGAAVTSLLFVVGQMILAWYLSNAGSTYGAVGSLVVFLLWVYYSAQILFFGAEFTQVYARHSGASIQPAPNAIRVEKFA